MDGLSVAASIMAVVQLTGACLKLGKKFLGPSQHSPAGLDLIAKSLYDFNGAIKNLQTHYEINEDDQTRLNALNHLAEPLKRCEEALEIIRERLQNTTFLGRYVVGERFDRKLKKSLQVMEEARKLFEMALYSDQLIITRAVESYIRNVAEDVRDIHTIVNENGKRLRDLDCTTRENYEQAKRWRTDTGGKVRATQDVVLSIQGDVRSIRADDHLLRIHQWLSPPDPSSNHNAACRKRHARTGSWLTEGRLFTDWKVASNSILWLYGIPGCGKTVLCSTIIEEVSKYCQLNSACRMAYFYFDFNDDKKQQHENLIRSLIVQLSTQSEKYSDSLQALYSRSKDGKHQPSYDGLVGSLKSMLQLHPKTYIILDALDECADREELLKLLQEISIGKVQVLATSRKERDIEDALDSLFPQKVCIQSSQVGDDIQLFIRETLHNDPKLKKWPASVKDEISKKLMDGACGMFRWVVCQLDALRKCLTVDAVKKALETLPKTLDDTYDRILLSIGDEYAQDALRILQWLAFSARSLRIEEVAEIVAFNSECGLRFDPERRLTDQRDLLIICSSLVIISPATIENPYDGTEEIEELKLAHFSVKEYLVSKRIQAGPASDFSILEIPATLTIARTCLVYLLQFDKPDSWTVEIYQEYPLAAYAAQYWTQHARAIEWDASGVLLNPLIREVLGSRDCFLNWIRISDPECPGPERFFRRKEKDIAPQLYYVSLSGLCRVVDWLLERDVDVNAKGGFHGHALIAASSEGHSQIVKRLLERGADLNAQNGDFYGNALQAASRGGHCQIVDLLLEQGAFVNIQGGDFGNSLQAASVGGCIQIVQRLLEVGAEVNARGGYYGNALQAASREGHIQIVQQLLEAGAEVNAKGGIYGNALQAASAGGHIQIVNRLLEADADVNAQEGEYGNALQAASCGGHSQVVEYLLKKGAYANAQGGKYGNALQAASAGGHIQIVNRLFEAGADVNAQEGEYGNALQAASMGGHSRIVELLLKNGAYANAQGGKYGNALQAASSKGYSEIVEQLLDAGVEVNVQGGEYGNALQAASREGHSKIVAQLLEKGAYVNVGGKYGSAVRQALYKRHSQIIEQLLEKGAEVNLESIFIRDNAIYARLWGNHSQMLERLLQKSSGFSDQERFCGNLLQAAAWGGHSHIVEGLLGESTNIATRRLCNALEAASWGGHQQIVGRLLEMGSNANTRGLHNALIAASTGGHSQVVKLLLQSGAKVNASGSEHDNALIAASENGHSQVVKLLLESGADINTRGRKFGNALQAASFWGREETVKLLLECGADVNARGGQYGNTLVCAAIHGHTQIVRLLLWNGLDVNGPGGPYCDALQDASDRGYEQIVNLLLESGVDVNGQGGYYGNALQAASRSDHEQIVKVLLENGADVNAKGGKYGSALQAASACGHERIAKLLLMSGADANARGGEHGNALQAAICAGNLGIVRLLLSSGGEVDARGGKYGNALIAASGSGDERIVKLLLESGAGVNARGGEIGSALQTALSNGYHYIARMLIEYGAQPV